MKSDREERVRGRKGGAGGKIEGRVKSEIERRGMEGRVKKSGGRDRVKWDGKVR